MTIRVQMTEAAQEELILSLALAAGWMIRAIEEYGVGGPHKEDSETFILATQSLFPRIHEQLTRLGATPEGQAMTLTEAVQYVIKRHMADRGKKSGTS